MIHGVLQSLALQKFCYRLISCWHLPRISMDNNNNSFIYRLFFMVSVRFSNKSLMLLHPRIFIGHSLHSRSFLKSTRERNCYWVWKIRSRGRGWGERFIFSPPSHLSRSPLPTSTPLLIFLTPGALLLRSLVRSVRLGKERKWLLRRLIGEMEPIRELSKMLSVWHVTVTPDLGFHNDCH